MSNYKPRQSELTFYTDTIPAILDFRQTVHNSPSRSAAVIEVVCYQGHVEGAYIAPGVLAKGRLYKRPAGVSARPPLNGTADGTLQVRCGIRQEGVGLDPIVDGRIRTHCTRSVSYERSFNMHQYCA